MRVSFQCDTNLGEGLANVLRQSLIESSQSVRAVAYKLSEGNNLVTSSDDIMDVIQFASKLSKLNFEAPSHVAFPVHMNVQFSGILMSSQLQNSDIKVKDDVPLLQCIKSDKKVTVTVVFDKGSGMSTPEAIKSKLNLPQEFSTLCVRHSNCKVGFNVTQDISGDNVVLNIETPNNDEKDKMDYAISSIVGKLEEIRAKL